MKFYLTMVTVALAIMASSPASTPAQGQRVQPPPHQVIAMYFHRTQRCPTCKRIGALVEESIRQGYAKELETKAVEFRLIDFQDRKNATLAKSYKITGPILVLANVYKGKVVQWAPMPKVWQLVGKPAAFHAYVQDGLKKYLTQAPGSPESKE